MEKIHLLGKMVRNTVSGETGTVISVQAWDLNGAPGVFVEFVEVVRVDRRKQHPYMYHVWRIEDVEED